MNNRRLILEVIMKIREKIKEIKNIIKYKRKGKELELLSKNIEMMTIDEVTLELNSKLSRINKLEEIDSRTEELINYILQLKHGNSTAFILKMINLLKNDDLKLVFLDKFASKFNDEALNDIRNYRYDRAFRKDVNDDAKARRERKVNNIKEVINTITKRLVLRGNNKKSENPLELKIKFEEYHRLESENKERNEKIKAKIFAKNYERLNIYEIIRNSRFSLIEKICKELPQNIKGTFMLEYVRVREYNNLSYEEEERLENLILENVPIDILKSEIIQNLGQSDEIYCILFEKLEISSIDIQNYYRKTGHYPEILQNNIELEINTVEDVINELKYFKEGERKKFFLKAIEKLTQEDFEKLLESDQVDDELKSVIYKGKIFFKSNEEKLEIYEKLVSMAKDEKTKNNYRISIAKINGKYDEILEIIKYGEYDYWYLYNENILLKFSDEQLKEIYDITENSELRAHLLTLSRRGNVWLEEETEEIEEKDKFVLVKKENYVDFIRGAKSYEEITELFSRRFEEYKKEITFEQIIELYQDFLKKELKISHKERCADCFKSWINKDLNIEKFFELIKLNFSKSELENASRYCVIQDNLKIEEVESYIRNIIQINDLEVKEEIFERVIDKYISIPYFAPEGSEEFIEYEKRIAKLENLYENLLNSNELDFSDKYFILAQYMKEFYDRVRGNDKKFIEKFEFKFSNLNEEAGRCEYTEIFDFTPIYVESAAFGTNINSTNYNNIIDCIKNLGSDIVYKKLVDLYNQNHSIKQNIYPKLLNEEVVQLLDDEIIGFVSRYSVDASSFSTIIEDENKTNLFIKVYDRIKNIKAYSENDALKIAEFIEKLSEQEINNYEIDEKNLDLIIAISLSEELRKKYFEIQVKDKENKLEKFVENIKEESRKEIHSPLLTRMQALDAIGIRFFGISYDVMQEMVSKYTVDLDEMIHKYETKDFLTEEELNEVKTLKVLQNIKEIMDIQEKEILVKTFEELDKLEEFEDIDFSLANVLDENARRVYAKDYKENVYCLDENDKLEDQIDGIDIYSPKEFNMLVHVVAAYGDFKLIDKDNPDKSAKDAWRNIDDKKNHILCTSYIGNSNLCYAKPQEDNSKETRIIFGFSNFSDNSVLMAAPYDIGSETTTMDSNSSYYSSSFRTAKNMIKNTRWNHNEVCVERRLENQKDSNIEPDYIVCFDEISEESKKVAKDFGIPIVLLDSKEIAKNESERLDGLLKEFYKRKDASIIGEILTSYQTNTNSFYSYKHELIEEYFSSSDMNENIEKMMQCIEKEYKIGNRDNAIRCYAALYKAFQDEINLNLENGIDPEENTNGKFRIREFNFLAKQNFEKVKKQLYDTTMTTEHATSEEIVNQVVSGIKERNKTDGR